MRPTEESLPIKAKSREVESIEERAGTVARSGQCIFLVFVILVQIARLKHDIIEIDFVLVKWLSMSET